MTRNLPKRILVAGGAGFIGSHLCQRLLTEGNQVYCLDDFSTGSRGNIEEFMGHPQFRLIEHDVALPLALEIDEIYNLACPASPSRYQADPIKTMKTCVIGTMNLLDLTKPGVKLLQASTSEVYGDPVEHPQKEDYWGNVNPIGVRACYDEGKRSAETLCFDYRRQYGANVKVARIFNTYGPRMTPEDGRVVSNFIVQALKGAPITIYGDGSQTRSFCFVDDLVRGLVLLMATGNEVSGPFNMGNPCEFTIRQLAEKVLAATGSASKLIELPLPEDDPRQRKPDITRATNQVGWSPEVPLDDGLGKTIDYFDELLSKRGTKDAVRQALWAI